MSNIVREQDFELLDAGLQNATVRDVVDLGIVTSKWEGEERSANKHRLIFEAEERDSHGRVIYLRRDCTSFLAPKAKLTEFVEALLGRQLTVGEKRDFDLDDLIGLPCQLVVVHQTSKSDGKTYANISQILTWPAKLKPPRIDPDYVRVQDRRDYNGPIKRAPTPVPKPKPVPAASKDHIEDGVSLDDMVKHVDMRPPAETYPPASTKPFVGTDNDIPF